MHIILFLLSPFSLFLTLPAYDVVSKMKGTVAEKHDLGARARARVCLRVQSSPVLRDPCLRARARARHSPCHSVPVGQGGIDTY